MRLKSSVLTVSFLFGSVDSNLKCYLCLLLNHCFLSLDTLLKARTGLKGFLEDSSYETDTNLGRGRRKRRARQLSSSDDEDGGMVLKQTTKEIPPPQLSLRTLRLPNKDHPQNRVQRQVLRKSPQ